MNKDPINLFQEWFIEAKSKELSNPDAASLATATLNGGPSVRMILLKGVDQEGFVFFTNKKSHKGSDLSENPRAAMCFYWKTMSRQVRVEGDVKELTEKESDKYFFSRSRESRIGAWASKQSQPLTSKFELEERVAYYTKKFESVKIPRPKFWLGYCLKPNLIEFWSEGAFRLHDRIVYHADDKQWKSEYLFP